MRVKNLVVVESPAKAKTIERYLGPGYKVLASYGHVRDLPEKGLGVDLENKYQPEYEVSGRPETVLQLKKAAKDASMVYLATDLDREGEAIAWHVKELLKLPATKTKRVTFNQITESVIQQAFKHPRQLDMDLVDAQTARRVLDRLVGYKLSPLLWSKIRRGLSAGRVQSVTVRLVVDREAEIKAFKAEEYWAIRARLEKPGNPPEFLASLMAEGKKKLDKLSVKNEKQARAIEKAVKGGKWKVVSVEEKPGKRSPAAPFTTSTLQMEAARRLGMSAKRTMTIAQHLYEAGHITYMRTDSVHLAPEAVKAARALIVADYGDKFLPEKTRVFKARTRGAQEAHEAVRPSHINKRAEDLGNVDSGERRLYELIWQRAVASQMADAALSLKDARISVDRYSFQAKGETIVFPGFLKLYAEEVDDAEPSEAENVLPDLKVGDDLKEKALLVEQKFTQPPPRYSEATLIKALEAHGIGRPSTYAPTLTTIQERGYVRLEEKRFFPEEIGVVVTELLKQHFPEIVDLGFTADIEDELDDIARGKREWVPVIDAFYQPFSKLLKEKEKSIERSDYEEKTTEVCPKCGKGHLVAKFGRFGKFLTCDKYPDCDYSRSADQAVDKDGEPKEVGKCPDCGKPLVERRSRFGKFIGCSGYPECKYIQNDKKADVVVKGIKCPKDAGDVVEKKTRRGKVFWGCGNYPKCDFATWNDPKGMTVEQLKEEEAKSAENAKNKKPRKAKR